MFRLLTHLLGKPFEECKSCETLKQQLNYERQEKKELTQTLLNILQPKAIIQDAPVAELQPLSLSAGTFAKRRAAMEHRDRIQASILAEKKHLGVPDNINKPNAVITDTPLVNVADESVEKLEQELGLTSEG